MKRTFIAIRIEPEAGLLRVISSIKTLLANENIKWVDPANIHLTLSFLGDTEEKRIKLLSEMLIEKCTGFGEFEFVLVGTGVFKSFRDTKVIWTGIKDPENLTLLNNSIIEGLKESGFPVEDRPFKPHLTLGRIRSVRDAGYLTIVLEKHKEEFQKVQVSEVILFESILQQTGPIYKPLGKFSLV
jgi:2'-5' RNA ligase